ncbi:E3 ubiquitin-protein ligase MARCHF7-like [Oncorhynchus keta]|uniref:E3 ubiquitin-protein ligase MARCHF7-like n=1 Tax=Oncorhynchus keta TaxID=8018 RepID=UPI0015F7EC22|nr:E3 ubiquitin-protein ligase MARCHF7-like [Oncorhynchus keta]
MWAGCLQADLGRQVNVVSSDTLLRLASRLSSQSVMDSKPRRLPFTVSGTTSSYSSSSSPSSLGSSRLYGRPSVLNSDRFTRATPLKPDLDHQVPPSSRFLSSTRDYSSSDSCHSSWKSPLTTSSVSYDRSWAESSLSSRSKLTDSERRLGTYSGLLSNTTDDGDNKRVKLSYTNRAAYTRSPSSSVTGSSYSSSILRDSDLSSWKSSSSSSEPLWSRRELEKRTEGRSLSSEADTSYRSSGLTSSLYRPDRVTSTYAQGARPKETLYSSSSRESSSLSRHLSSTYQRFPLARDSTTSWTTGHSLTTSTLRTTKEPTESPEPTLGASVSSRPSSWYTTPSARREARDSSPPPSAPTTTPRTTPEGGEASDGCRSTRRLLSRLFSRRSSQDSSGSSSGSTSRSFDSAEDSPVVEGPSHTPVATSEESVRPVSVEPVPRGSDAAQAFAFLRRRRQGLSPVQEGQTQRGLEAWRGGSTSGVVSSTSGSSWLSSSIQTRCTPLFSRRRREGRDESARLASGADEDCRGTQFPLRRRDSSEAEDDDEEEEEVAASGAMGASVALQEELRDMAGSSQRLARFMSSPLFRVHDNVMIAVDVTGAAGSQPECQEKPTSSRDPERLRKIQESLLLEDSDEEEGDLCRICQMGEESPSNPLIEPCRCTGSLQYVHQDCIKKWLRSKISSGTNLDAITTCELCKEKLHLNIDNFDINELHRTHEKSEYEFISCGLYLVVLLHLCEQRFSDVLGAANDAGFFNLARTLHEHMDNLESSYGESDEEVVDTRPSIDFCDLDEDLEEEYN